jgi:hypothetical protein
MAVSDDEGMLLRDDVILILVQLSLQGPGLCLRSYQRLVKPGMSSLSVFDHIPHLSVAADASGNVLDWK